MLNLLAQVQEKELNLRPTGRYERLGNLQFADLIRASLSFILVVAAIVFFFILVIGGVKWILSGGDKAHTEAARNQITAALVGLVIVFAAWAIASLIGTFFGISIFDLTIPTI